MNYLVIVADDLRYDLVRFMPETRRRLAALGTQFTSCRANVPLCQPSRVGMLSGQYSKRHNVINNSAVAGGIPGDYNRDSTIGTWMTASHRTGFIGKYLNAELEPSSAPAGWDTLRETFGTALGFPEYGYSMYNGTTTTNPAVGHHAFLEAEAETFMAGAEPWFLWLTPYQPHYPWASDRERIFAWQHVNWWSTDLWSSELSVSDKPSWVQALPALTAADREAVAIYARHFMRATTTLDAMIGRLLDLVDFGDTTVFFTSDNGVMLGEHNHWGIQLKNVCYEPALHVPLLVRGPAFPPGINSDLTNHQDIAATICATENITAPIPLDGVDLRDTDPNRVLLHELDADGGRPAGAGISTEHWKFFRYDDTGNDEFEMYWNPKTPAYVLGARVDDPNEFDNEANQPGNWPGSGASYSSIRNTLEGQLDALLA